MRSASLWEFSLAIVVLWLVMEYVPYGVMIGVFILALAMLETPEAINGISSLLYFVQTGTVVEIAPPKTASNSGLPTGVIQL